MRYMCTSIVIRLVKSNNKDTQRRMISNEKQPIHVLIMASKSQNQDKPSLRAHIFFFFPWYLTIAPQKKFDF